MRLRLTLLGLTLAPLLLGGPARAQDKAAPAATAPANVYQIQPLGRVIADLRAFTKVFGGDKAVKEFNDGLRGKLGEKEFAGLDLGRPILGFQVLDGNYESVKAVVYVPITGRDDFKALLKRLDIGVELLPNEKDLYEVELPESVKYEGDVFVRLSETTAYFAVGADKAALDPAALPKPEQLIIPGETGLLATKTYFGRIPKDQIAKIVDQVDQAAAQFDALPLPAEAKERLVGVMKVAKKYTLLQYEQGESAVARVSLDPKNLTAAVEYALAPKAGSKLVGDLEARKPTTNLFAGAVGPDTVAAFTTRLPFFLPELREGTADLLALAEDKALGQVPPNLQDLAKEALTAIGRTAKTGQFDLMMSLNGPQGEGGKSSLFAGIAFDDPSKVEAELKKLHAGLDDNVRNIIKLDVAKANGVSIHKANVGAFFPPEAQNVFGDEASVAFAFAPKGVYVVAGKDSVESLKKFLAMPPKPAKVLDILVNGKKVKSLLAARGDLPPDLPQLVKDGVDGLASVVSIDVTGGKALSVKFLADLRLIPQKPKGEE